MKKVFLIPLLTIAAIGSTLASDGSLNISANYFQATCQLDSSTQNFAVPMKNIPAAQMTNMGDVGEGTEFSIKFTHCSPGSTAYIAFEGAATKNDLSLFALDNHAGAAQNVGLEIYLPDNANNYRIWPNTQQVGYNAQTGTTIDARYNARYVAVGNNVTAGDANVMLQFSVKYN